MAGGVEQKSVIIKGEVLDPQSLAPMDNLFDYALGRPGLEALGKSGRRAIGAGKRAPPSGQNTGIGQAGIQVECRIRPGRKALFNRFRAFPQDFSQDLHFLPVPRPRENPVSAGMFPGVIRAKGGIGSSQENGNPGKVFPQELDGLKDSRVPVGHGGGHQDQVGGLMQGKELLHSAGGNSITAVMAGDILQRPWFGYDFLEKMALAVFFSPGWSQARCQAVRQGSKFQAVEEGDPIPLRP